MKQMYFPGHNCLFTVEISYNLAGLMVIHSNNIIIILGSLTLIILYKVLLMDSDKSKLFTNCR